MFVIFFSCQNDDLEVQVDKLTEELETVKRINNILELKNVVNEAKFSEILVAKIVNVNGMITIGFEDNSICEVPDNILLDYEIDNADWQVHFTLADSSSLSTFFLGDELIINENDIDINPFNIAPLISIINIETPVNGKFNIRVIGQDGESSDITILPDYYGSDHTLGIFGLYAEYANQVELTFTSKEGIERIKTIIPITTDELPAGLPGFNIVKQYDEFDPNTLILINYRPTHIPFMVDPFGKIRWYSTGFSKVIQIPPPKETTT